MPFLHGKHNALIIFANLSRAHGTHLVGCVAAGGGIPYCAGRAQCVFPIAQPCKLLGSLCTSLSESVGGG